MFEGGAVECAGQQWVSRDDVAAAELDVAFSELTAAALQMQHALHASEEGCLWQHARTHGAQPPRPHLMPVAAGAQLADPGAAIGGVLYMRMHVVFPACCVGWGRAAGLACVVSCCN